VWKVGGEVLFYDNFSAPGFELMTAAKHWRILVGLAATFGDCSGWCENLLTQCLAMKRLYMICLVNNGF
jgi:hypothetical protein